MTATDFVRQMNTYTASGAGKQRNAREILCSLGLVPSRDQLTPKAAAWLVIGSLAPTCEKKRLRAWLTEQNQFFADMAKAGEATVLSILTKLFSDKGLADEAAAVFIERTTLVTTIQHTSGDTMTPTRYSAKAIPQVAELVKIDGEAIREIWKDMHPYHDRPDSRRTLRYCSPECRYRNAYEKRRKKSDVKN